MVSENMAFSAQNKTLTTNSSSKHVQWSKLAGYFLNSKRNSDGWEEVSLDYDLLSYKVLILKRKISIVHSSLYDLLSYKLTNLSCGSVYSFNLIAHNIAGRSKPRWVVGKQEWELKNVKR